MTTENIDDRVSRIEGALPYLATKADLESLRGEMYRMEARLVKWMVGSVVAVAVIMSSVTITAFRFLGA